MRSKEMIIGKPRYDAAKKLYECSISDGIQLRTEIESGVYRPTLTQLESETPALVSLLLEKTNGWFKKPLTRAGLENATKMSLEAIPAGFEGCIVWTAHRLVISKEVFLVEFAVSERVAAEPIHIDFSEPEPAPEPEPEPVPVPQPPEPPSRESVKEHVLEARRRAARALFRAERMTQDYIQKFCPDGEETDWEDEDSDS